MKELFRLKSFLQILLWFFLLGVVLGGLITVYYINPVKFKIALVLPSIPTLYFISKGLYKNSRLFFTDFKVITVKV